MTVVIIDTDLDVGALWAAVEEAVPRTAVAGAVATLEAQVPEDDGSAEADVLAGLSLSEAATEHLDQLVRGLDAAWRQMADRLQEAGDDAKVEVVVPEAGRHRLGTQCKKRRLIAENLAFADRPWPSRRVESRGLSGPAGPGSRPRSRRVPLRP
ncbi:hypothetical protein [Kitasatospora sp. NPDC127116]|uniref:hypothetical protein n=1 Tax=Kitasatospora sp. NPDC127116 TaxID=3345367 RepID=UPI003639AC5D